MYQVLTYEEVAVDIRCSYCGCKAIFVPTSCHLYGGRDYGPVWDCRACDAYVGVNGLTGLPHGTLANKELRYWRKLAHAMFDPLWQKKKHGVSRHAAYQHLARFLGVPEGVTHIGMFDVVLCKSVVRLCSNPQWYRGEQCQ